MTSENRPIAVIGAGIVGIATAYYLARNHSRTNITLVDQFQPMSFTSAQSGNNFRNWWPHSAMVSLTNRSIDLMEQISRDTDNRIGMTRRGYVVATREQNIDTLVSQLRSGLGDESDTLVRYHDQAEAPRYFGPSGSDCSLDVNGVDILCHYDLIRKHFPHYDPEVQTVVHIRRGGEINSQQLATYMLEFLKSVGAKRLMGQVREINPGNNYQIEIDTGSGSVEVVA
ncbi:MAG: FAD-binding oxidoreductase, partial [Proteobacteria bacterium]|nr:FAD-binding oxidoreductase [Pseudomonadota bacterium]